MPPCLTDVRAGHVDAASQRGNRRVGSRSRLPTEWELAPIEEAQGACAHHWMPSWLIELSIRSIRTRATRYFPFPASRTLATPVLARPISPSIPNSGIRACQGPTLSLGQDLRWQVPDVGVVASAERTERVVSRRRGPSSGGITEACAHPGETGDQP